MAAEELAARFGTPLYVYDAATLRERARRLRRRRRGHPDAHVSFACKACCTVGVLRLLSALRARRRRRQRGRARRRPARRHRARAHRRARQRQDRRRHRRGAWRSGCGLLVLDGLDEGARVAAAAERHGRRQPVAVRVTPGIAGRQATRRSRPGTRAPSSAWRRPTPRVPASRRARSRGSTGAACTCTSARRSTMPACSRASCAGSASSATRMRWSRA